MLRPPIEILALYVALLAAIGYVGWRLARALRRRLHSTAAPMAP